MADYFSLTGYKYLLYADRYSAWISVVKIHRDEADFKFLKGFLLHLFCTFGVPEELSTDGGSPFKGHEYKRFLERWDIQPRLSAAYYPQSNGRAELAVKVAKRIILGNSEVNGDINNELVSRALLQHRNTPLQGIGLSPAQILYGRNLKDCLPSQQEALSVRSEWRNAADERERALRNRHVKAVECYNEHTKDLPELQERDYVVVQNQDGNHPKRWDKTGRVVGKLPFRQYRIKMDGSNRVTLRNRKFLRKIEPVCGHPTGPSLAPSTIHLDTEQHTVIPNIPNIPPSPHTNVSTPIHRTPVRPASIPQTPSNSDGNPSRNDPFPAPAVEVRTSNRNRRPRELFEASIRGKTHGSKTLPQ